MNKTAALNPGDIDAMFKALPERWAKYNATLVSEAPYIATFDNFVSDREIESILAHAKSQFKRSTDQGAYDERGVQQQKVSTSRTSENAWCLGACQEDPVVQGVNERISAILNIPIPNFEQFQILRYEKGQKYATHHDMSPSDTMMPAGPRIFTFFLYFSEVEAGGETGFPKVGADFKVKPKKGSAVLWPSVLSDNPMEQDGRTVHEAVPVESGIKYAANAWVHLYPYNVPRDWGCVGSFG
eukprot:TRINITY_DN57916_c0_g1_i1.p1 TRINITY_DN57916_c0_g1~~TRINITY_DN57916_c0_g1_i1.p1  ORF type:complete len:241 (-),score=44.01 TRINITY_DN57916_c0_g1_i1:315-1037(-)